MVARAVARRSSDQGFGTYPVQNFCKCSAVYRCDRCPYLTNTCRKSSPDGSVVRAADCNPSLSLVPLRWTEPARCGTFANTGNPCVEHSRDLRPLRKSDASKLNLRRRTIYSSSMYQ
ncbi:hypothetical protein Y032_0042g547 [Ancylostoma ceylanicum]|uniref:Uncharacterized protein n=1 Tax=Ancylostoma ceylanicum TaxID=53326 RepID=A0A016UF67_9BILA|nr:hypothetical protein Y032_0042g547 [Ancylostoma ceylanicum]